MPMECGEPDNTGIGEKIECFEHMEIGEPSGVFNTHCFIGEAGVVGGEVEIGEPTGVRCRKHRGESMISAVQETLTGLQVLKTFWIAMLLVYHFPLALLL